MPVSTFCRKVTPRILRQKPDVFDGNDQSPTKWSALEKGASWAQPAGSLDGELPDRPSLQLSPNTHRLRVTGCMVGCADEIHPGLLPVVTSCWGWPCCATAQPPGCWGLAGLMCWACKECLRWWGPVWLLPSPHPLVQASSAVPRSYRKSCGQPAFSWPSWISDS